MCIRDSIIDFFSEKELELLLSQPNQSNVKDRRNLTMMITLYDTGARIQELLDIRAVSYTHLDVYKRQMMISLMS